MNKRDFGRAESVLDQSSRTPEWFLGYDAACSSCQSIEEVVKEVAEGSVATVDLRDPVVEGWRREALGKDGPFAPTLFRVHGDNVTAWVGKSMVARLVRVLGPRKTKLLINQLGLLGETRPGVNRRTLAKGILGGLAAAGAIGTSLTAVSASNEEPPEEPITEEEAARADPCALNLAGYIYTPTKVLAELALRNQPCEGIYGSVVLRWIPCGTWVDRSEYHDQDVYVYNNCVGENRRRWYKVTYLGTTGYIASAYTNTGLGYDPGCC